MIPDEEEYKELFNFYSTKIKNHTDFINRYEKGIELGKKPFIEGHMHLKKARDLVDEYEKELSYLKENGFYTEDEETITVTHSIGKYKFNTANFIPIGKEKD